MALRCHIAGQVQVSQAQSRLFPVIGTCSFFCFISVFCCFFLFNLETFKTILNFYGALQLQIGLFAHGGCEVALVFEKNGQMLLIQKGQGGVFKHSLPCSHFDGL